MYTNFPVAERLTTLAHTLRLPNTHVPVSNKQAPPRRYGTTVVCLAPLPSPSAFPLHTPLERSALPALRLSQFETPTLRNTPDFHSHFIRYSA